MGIRDCLVSAAEQGEITLQEAGALADEFDAKFAQNRLSMSDDAAAANARIQMEKEYRIEAAEKRRKANLTEAARIRVKGRLMDYKNKNGEHDPLSSALGILSHYGFRNGSSVRGRSEAIIGGAHGKLADVMFAMQRQGVFGRRNTKVLETELAKELHGEASGSAVSKGFARAINQVFEDLRQRYNAAGGNIAKLENFGLPHSHDRLKVKTLKREPWKKKIKPLLNPSKMTHPLTGERITVEGLDKALDHVYASIVSNGRSNIEPKLRSNGKGSIGNQRQDERFLVFNDGESWLQYHREFGEGDFTQSIFQHINGMAKDIAAMEELGPNPANMVEYIKQAVVREIGLKEAGKSSKAAASILKDSQAPFAEFRIDALWQSLRGDPTVVSGAANTTASIKNVLTSAQLGATAGLAASTDPFIARAARKLADLPVTSTIKDMVSMIKSSNREEIIRSGVVWDEYLHVMGDELRFAGPAVGADWSRWLADRSVMWSGLKPLTTGRKLVEARAWQSHIADLANEKVSFDKLDKRFKTTLEGFGVTQEDWNIWKSAIDQNGFVTARQMELNGGDVQFLNMGNFELTNPAYLAEVKALAHRNAAEKLTELITSWSERSVPSGTVNARSVVTSTAPRGTVAGELVDYALQYKSFGLSFTTMQLEAMGEMAAKRGGGNGMRTGAGYMASLIIPLSIGAGAWLQIKSLLDGKDPADMTETSFWVKATFSGGGFGLFGDFAQNSENRFGQGFAGSLSGPGISFLGDSFDLVLGNALQFMRGEDTKIGRDVVRYLGRNTPVLSSHWATRAAYRRVFLDNLQWMVDPSADKSFKSKARLAKKNGAEFFLPPGTFTPSRSVGSRRNVKLERAIGN